MIYILCEINARQSKVCTSCTCARGNTLDFERNNGFQTNIIVFTVYDLQKCGNSL